MLNPRTICFTSTIPAMAFRSVETPPAGPTRRNRAPRGVRSPLLQLPAELLLISMFPLHRLIMEQSHSHIAGETCTKHDPRLRSPFCLAPNCTLSPPKHQLVQVATITASDALSGVATLTVTATSSEPDSGTGGGDVPGDIVINGGIMQLRAERSPSGKGRTYTINATAVDVSGEAATSTGTSQGSK